MLGVGLGVGDGVGLGVGDGVGLALVVGLADLVGLALVVEPLPCLPPGCGLLLPCAAVVVIEVRGVGAPAPCFCCPVCPGRADAGDAPPEAPTSEGAAPCGPASGRSA